DEFAAGKPRAPGSAIGRQGAAPEGGPLTLSDPSLFDGTRAKPIKSLPNAPKPSKGAKEPAS
ncbi:hypothetical protein ABS198_22050, partial [Acinetobacter baumannii]|uniref:hypothetical protein n=1 Tax=Acinetobacter baumannii TaxID=470 RepID=UPI0033328198